MALTLATADHMGNALRYKSGIGSTDNAVIVQTGDVSSYNSFRLTHTSTGTSATDVFASLDGVNYASAPLTLTDMGSTAVAPATVNVTADNRVYGFFGTYASLRVQQNGAVAPQNVTLMCSRSGSA